MTSKERFEAWFVKAINRDCIFEVFTVGNIYKREPGEYTSTQLQCAWEAWQAAEAQAVRRCFEIVNSFPATREGLLVVIKDEFPEAFK